MLIAAEPMNMNICSYHVSPCQIFIYAISSLAHEYECMLLPCQPICWIFICVISGWAH